MEHRTSVASREQFWPDTSASFATLIDTYGESVLCVQGEIDVHTAPSFRRELAAMTEDGASSIVIDGRDLEFIDSSGLRVIVEVSTRCRERGGSLCLRNLRPSVRRIFEISALDRLLLIAG